ncbi:MAG: DNA-binding domain-containing protein [Hyphomicrobiales bacterium]|nr:DNA-binding domain-containing protein [Hyphomicrobiales bacterium]
MSRPDPAPLVAVADFAAAIEDRDRAPPGSVRVERGDVLSRFAVYRNNVWVARLDILDGLFPVASALVGADFFHAVARRFFHEAAPGNPVAHEWAEPFVDWLDASGAVADWPWLVDVARLEAAWLFAHHAAEAEPIGPAALAGIAPEDLLARRLRLHPSLGLVASDASIGTIWAAHQGDAASDEIDATRPETVLIVRPQADVVVATVSPVEAAFVATLGADASLGEAIEAALAADPAFDPGARLAALLRLGAVVGLD